MESVNKRSRNWQFFDIYEVDAKFAMCSLCQSKISRGGEGKKAGTSTMKHHIKNKHSEKYVVTTVTVPSMYKWNKKWLIYKQNLGLRQINCQ